MLCYVMSSMCVDVTRTIVNNFKHFQPFPGVFTVLLIAVRAVFILKCIDAVVSGLILPSRYIAANRNLTSTHPFVDLELQHNNGMTISAAVLDNPDYSRWLLFLMPNGVVMEASQSYLNLLSEAFEANVVTLNYRGVSMLHDRVMSSNVHR